MSKIANYLRGHLLGEIDFRPDVRQAYINDAGVLSLAPEMIVSATIGKGQTKNILGQRVGGAQNIGSAHAE